MKIKNIEGLSVAQINNMVNQGGKFVIFPYTVSIAVMTFKRSSSIYFIKNGESTIKYSSKHVLTNLVMGWWGLPWGPIYTIGAIITQSEGGKNVTNEVMSSLRQSNPQADTSTYNINGNVSSNNPQSDTSSYNVNGNNNSNSNNQSTDAPTYNVSGNLSANNSSREAETEAPQYNVPK